MAASKFSVSPRAQHEFTVIGNGRPSSADALARDALARARAGREAEAVHITRRSDGWAVKTEGRERASSIEPTQAAAEAKGREKARAAGARLIVHRTDGRIRENTKPKRRT